MPTELIAMIMDYLSKKNIIALGLASIKLWDHVLYYIRSTALANDSAPWAGKEIACVGTLVTDLPKSFNKYGPHSEYLSEYYSRPDMCPAKLFVAWASSFFSKPLPDRPGIKWLRSAHRWHTYTPPVQDIIRACDLGFRDRNLSWVLRNLDTYEYITCCCEAEMSDYDFKGRIRDFPQLNWRGFVKSKDEIHRWLRIEDVVVARICSSEERDHEPTPDAAKISMKGPWVGHRFDIVALGTQDFPNVEGWIDITTQIIDESDEYLKKLGRSRSDLMPLPCGSEISH
ncbi:MAG: hypothetical protein M1820_004061 [Bogoriella megaspora]|nr:MAG: hypothetical protein M1820_004061 [Bogoriella megaspora]